MKKLIFVFMFMICLTGYSKEQTAVLAGGCFWCMEPPFEKEQGVISVTSGYAGGFAKNPTYKEVSSGKTGHREAIKIVYDDQYISYEKILDIFWRQINPTDSGGQFVDRGFQYSSAIYYMNQEQKKQANSSKDALDKSGKFIKNIVTPVIPYTNFYPAEDYHQDYYKKNKLRYKYYRFYSGRDQFLDSIWK